MKTFVRLLMCVASAALYCAGTFAAEQKNKPETPMLPASAYRTSLEEVIVEGKLPYWRGDTAPRWDKSKVEAPKPDEAQPGRMQWLPHYAHEERDDYNSTRDQLANPPPRTKLFEIRF